MDFKPTLFISIASYRDSELIPTLCDMVKKSFYPESLNITVCWQHDDDISLFLNAGMQLASENKQDDFDLFIFSYQGAKIQALSVHYFHSKGACWARSMCESLYNGEDYFLQIDSHCRFTDDWDKEMLSMYQLLRKNSVKPVISTYPPGYQPDDEDNKANHVSRLVFREISKDGLVLLTSTAFKENAPIRGSYLAGGFIFSSGKFVKEVPNDPQIFFEGEEIAMAARVFTHGYDVYYPHKPLLWHFYGRREHKKVWSDHNGKAKESGSVDLAWWDRDRESKRRVRMLLGIEADNGSISDKYRLGQVRTLRQFEYTIGVDFKSGAIQPEVIDKSRLAYFDYKNCIDDAWMKRLIRKNKKLIKIEKEHFSSEFVDIAYWHIGVYSDKNELLSSEHHTPDNINKRLSELEDADFTVGLEFKTSHLFKPHTVRVCPYSETQGWGKVVEKPW